jgi:hypothetical protein
LASEFEETWDFKRTANGTHVSRSFRFHDRSDLTRLLLRALSFFLNRAIAQHLRAM